MQRNSPHQQFPLPTDFEKRRKISHKLSVIETNRSFQLIPDFQHLKRKMPKRYQSISFPVAVKDQMSVGPWQLEKSKSRLNEQQHSEEFDDQCYQSVFMLDQEQMIEFTMA